MIKKFLSNLAILPKMFYRVPFLVPYWNGEEFREIITAIFTGRLIRGESREKFVEDFLNFIDLKYGFATNMGRSAIELTLRGLGLGAGDEIILPTFCCRGVIIPVIKAGCTPVFADIGDDFNINPESVREYLTPKTRAVIVAHLSGKVAKIDEIKEIIKNRNIFLIEDACQITGGKHGGKFLGTLGDVGIFSFGMGKNMMATAGGFLATNSQDLYYRILNIKIGNEKPGEVLKRAIHRVVKFRFRKYSMPFFIIKDVITSKFVSESPSKYELLRISNLDAALLRLQLGKLEEIIEKRKRNAKILHRELSQIEEVVIPEFDEDNIFTKFIIIFKKGTKPLKIGLCQEVRSFTRYLKKYSIETEETYTPLHLRKEFKQYYRAILPKSEDLYWRATTIPVQPNLKEKDILYISNVIKRYFANKYYE